MIVVSIKAQVLCHRRRSGVRRCYPVSTAARGAGNHEGSLQTPLGRHRICAKIGGGYPLFTIFRGRRPVGIYDPARQSAFTFPRLGKKSGRPLHRRTIHPLPAHLQSSDWILSRILWLTGTEPGRNRRGTVDTKGRFIYIHGTHDEASLGTPVSHGCIRMDNLDMAELYAHVRSGERVLILE
ncbi:MAG TPA: L,D-transpeptidase [Mariprofundaceae bacterium]|nr:L,D-transpeptidase [Mariprofundaceae bacterium]